MSASMKKITYQDLSRFRVPEGFRGRGLVIVQLW
jgi:hypothetical protein